MLTATLIAKRSLPGKTGGIVRSWFGSGFEAPWARWTIFPLRAWGTVLIATAIATRPTIALSRGTSVATGITTAPEVVPSPAGWTEVAPSPTRALPAAGLTSSSPSSSGWPAFPARASPLRTLAVAITAPFLGLPGWPLFLPISAVVLLFHCIALHLTFVYHPLRGGYSNLHRSPLPCRTADGLIEHKEIYLLIPG